MEVRTWLLILALTVITQRLFELRLAAGNRAWAMERGGREFGSEHYPLFFLLHSGWLLGWIIEGWWLNRLSELWAVWLLLFLLAQGLRYWAIRTLGQQWNTRIIIVPGLAAIRSGPYKYFRHPNYIAVAAELIAVPLVFNAWRTALAATFLNAVILLAIRIPAEEKALDLYNENT